ncbi:hypothetical protein [Sphingomonas sp.]|uniref:hypothetical protein n=1 Tax=Sphingomonas sp. TaxID=28214 RepID=UPI003B00E949
MRRARGGGGHRLEQDAAERALGELQGHGFIAATIAGHLAVKMRVATCWRLT